MALDAEYIFIDSANNKWVSDSTNDFSTAYVDLLTQAYWNQIYGLAVDKYYNQTWSLLFPDITNYWSQVWSYEIMNYVVQAWSDAPEIMKIVHQYWWDAAEPVKYYHQDYGDYVQAIKAVHQTWSLLSEVQKYVNQEYSLSGDPIVQYINQLWNLEERDFVQRAWHQIYNLVAASQQDPTSDSYETDTTAGTYDSTTYPVETDNNGTTTETWTVTFTSATEFDVSGSQSGSVGSGDTSTDFTPTDSEGNPYFTLDATGWGGTWTTTETLTFSTYRGSAFLNFSWEIEGTSVFSPSTTIELDEDRITIDASMQIVNPNHFGLCEKGNSVIITVGTMPYHLIITDVSITATTKSIQYSLKCQSPIAALNFSSQPLLQKEYDEDSASNIMQDLADLANLTVDWQVYHNGYLVDWVIPQGELFANNEKPPAVMKKITDACGAAIQSKPDGNIEVLHEFPVPVTTLASGVTDWESTDPDYILNNYVNFESISAADEEKSGINTLYVSDQGTADKTYTLEEEEVSATRKRVLGYHTPWDTTSVYLDHSVSNDAAVDIFYNGIEEPVEPPYLDDEGESQEAELIQIVDGAGSVSKPIYSIVSASWGEYDSLGAITFSEDGSLSTEVNGESLLRIRYRTKYHVWTVDSPDVTDVQCILRLTDG